MVCSVTDYLELAMLSLLTRGFTFYWQRLNRLFGHCRILMTLFGKVLHSLQNLEH